MSAHPGGSAPFHDVSFNTTSINGVAVPELSHGVVGGIGPGGQLFEHQQQGLVMLGDGTIQRGIEGTRRCEICARESQVLSLNGRIAPVQGLLMSLHPVAATAHSAISGVPLCAAHQRRVKQPDGTVLVLAPAEAAALEEQAKARSWWRWLLGLFVQPSPPPPIR